MSEINHFSYGNSCWLQIKSHLITFGFKGVPKDLHFTISFNENSKDINFHISKNNSCKEDKPQLRIFLIEKELLENDIFLLTQKMFLKLFKPYMVKNNEIVFFSFDMFNDKQFSKKTENFFINNFRNYIKIKRKKRIKINSNIEEGFELFLNDDFLDLIFSNTEKIKSDLVSSADAGIILGENVATSVIRIGNNFYKMRDKLSLIDIFKIFMNEKTAKRILYKIKKGVIDVRNAKTCSDIKLKNKPIRLVKLKNKRNPI